MFDVKTSVEVASELILIADVKAHLYITHSDDDTYLTGLIAKARRMIEQETCRSIGSQTKIWTTDLCAGQEYAIPYGPVISVTSVALKSAVNTYDTLTVNDDYETDGQFNKVLKPFWQGRHKVTYTTGYTTLPDDLKQAILLQIVYLYENRGDKSITGLCDMARDMASGYKDYSWQ